MSLIYNGTEIPTSGEINYNGTSLTKIVYVDAANPGGVTVWEKTTTNAEAGGTTNGN